MKTRTGARARRNEAAVGRFVERFALIMSETGFPRMPARVFVALLIANEGLTAGELGEQLRVSPAAISNAVRYLVPLGLVSREREPGRRSDQYRIQNDMWYETLTRKDEVLIRWEQGLREGIEAVGEDTQAGHRLDETLRFFEFMRGEFPRLMEKWRQLRSGSSPG